MSRLRGRRARSWRLMLPLRRGWAGEGGLFMSSSLEAWGAWQHCKSLWLSQNRTYGLCLNIIQGLSGYSKISHYSLCCQILFALSFKASARFHLLVLPSTDGLEAGGSSVWVVGCACETWGAGFSRKLVAVKDAQGQCPHHYLNSMLRDCQAWLSWL